MFISAFCAGLVKMKCLQSIVLFITIVYLYCRLRRPKRKSLQGRHVVVTGGSSGIGKMVACFAAKDGAKVTIIGRNKTKLDEALTEIKSHCADNNEAKAVSLDVSDHKLVSDTFKTIEADSPIYMLVNCAGMAICHTVDEYNPAEIKQMIDTNYLGTLYPIQAVLSGMKQRKEGIIVLTGSQVSLMGMYGYSVYSSMKFALRGLAESLQMEVQPFGIDVTLSLPPDTDTPGFENENKTKPKETKLISESGQLYSPDSVAAKLLDDALTGRFFSTIGFESWIVTTLCVGMSPAYSAFETLVQGLVLGPLRLISCFFIHKFKCIIEKCHKEKQA